MSGNQAKAVYTNWMNAVKKERIANENLAPRDYRFGYRRSDAFYKGTVATSIKGLHMPGMNARGSVGP